VVLHGPKTDSPLPSGLGCDGTGDEHAGEAGELCAAVRIVIPDGDSESLVTCAFEGASVSSRPASCPAGEGADEGDVRLGDSLHRAPCPARVGGRSDLTKESILVSSVERAPSGDHVVLPAFDRLTTFHTSLAGDALEALEGTD